MSVLLRRSLIGALSGGGINVSDVFSVDLYTGTGATINVNNGLDLSSEGGLVWLKSRSVTANHVLTDTARGATKIVFSNDTTGELTANSVTAFNSDGYDVGIYSVINNPGETYAGWSFRKSPKFFDVITYTGDGVAGRQIPHNLGVQAGFVAVKCLSNSTQWICQHVSRGGTKALQLNQQAAEISLSTAWNDTTADDSVVTLGTTGETNANGRTYVMYVFAHDDSDSGAIQCGQYTGNGSSTGPIVNLGWEPQYLLVKAAGAAGDWHIVDSTRGQINSGNDKVLKPNLSNSENIAQRVDFNPTGFQIKTSQSFWNPNGADVIYMAIRAES